MKRKLFEREIELDGKQQWHGRLPGEDFDLASRRAVHDGLVADSALPRRNAIPDPAAVESAVAEIAKTPGAGTTDTLQLALRSDPTVYDGRFANNGWLQECPKPITKLTWDNAVLLAPRSAEIDALKRRLMGL